MRLVLLLTACSAADVSDMTVADLATPTNLGLVVMYSDLPFDVIFDGGVGESSAGGSTLVPFFDTVTLNGTPPPSGCTSTAIGDCNLVNCPPPATGDLGFSTAVTHHSAGLIQVSGGVSVAPNADGSYTTRQSTQPLWNGSETISVAGTGGEVPAFSASLVAPPAAMVSAPNVNPTDLAVDRSKDLAFSWSGAGEATFFVELNAHGGNRPYIQCNFAGATGHATLPAALLGKLPAGDGDFSGAFVSLIKVAAGASWTVEVRASSQARQTNGVSLAGQIKLQ
jgi:hypothetical protein